MSVYPFITSTFTLPEPTHGSSGSVEKFGLTWSFDRYDLSYWKPDVFSLVCSLPESPSIKREFSLKIVDQQNHTFLSTPFTELTSEQDVDCTPLKQKSRTALTRQLDIQLIIRESDLGEPTMETMEQLNKDLRSLLESSTMSDFVFEVEGREFKAHKAIVSVRSPVLARMLSSDCLETSTNRMQIIDVTKETFCAFLNFIYTASIPKWNTQQALDLLVIADKYEVLLLKKLCCYFLLISLKDAYSEMVPEIFKVAHLHNCCRALIRVAFKAIQSNFSSNGYLIDDEMIDSPTEVLQLVEEKNQLEENLKKSRLQLKLKKAEKCIVKLTRSE